jgi:hypothetical protein
VADSECYCRLLGLDFGPISENGLQELIIQGTVGPTDEVRCGGGSWRRVAEVPRWRELNGTRQFAPCPVAPRVAEGGPQGWYMQIGGAEHGPVGFDELRRLSTTGKLSPSDRVREGISETWFRAATLPGLFADLNRSRSVAGQAALLSPPQSATVPPPAPAPVIPKPQAVAQPVAASAPVPSPVAMTTTTSRPAVTVPPRRGP